MTGWTFESPASIFARNCRPRPTNSRGITVELQVGVGAVVVLIPQTTSVRQGQIRNRPCRSLLWGYHADQGSEL